MTQKGPDRLRAKAESNKPQNLDLYSLCVFGRKPRSAVLCVCVGIVVLPLSRCLERTFAQEIRNTTKNSIKHVLVSKRRLSSNKLLPGNFTHGSRIVN